MVTVNILTRSSIPASLLRGDFTVKRCLITGGAGFIGSHLSEYLLNEGHAVTIIDDLSTGSMKNIQHLKNHPHFKYHIDTCENKNLMAELIDETDECYHLAAAVGVKMIVENPSKTIHLNYSLTEIVLQMAAKKNKPVLVTSTSEVYGKSSQLPFNEEGDLVMGASTKWRWSYACSKLLDEFMVLAAHRKDNVPAVIVRLFNTVGPRQTGRYGMVIPNFVEQAMQNKPITVYGDGEQSRCFCHVKDVVPMLSRLMNNPASYGQIYNIGSDESISINGLADLIRKKLDSKSTVELVPYEKAYNEGFEDMRKRVPDLQKIKRDVGFERKYNLNDIIDDVYADLKNQI